MIELVKFKPEHMALIEKADLDAKVLMLVGDLDHRAEQYAKQGPAVTMLLNGAILAVGGVIQFWPGVGEAWMMVAPEGRKKGLRLYCYMKAFLDLCFKEYGFHRIQASVLYDHAEAHKCVMRLGFVPEGMMVHYGPNKENFVRYARI
jgi:L-amino acid N-acyltransferase YncA